MKKYIDVLVNAISNHFDHHKEINGYVDRSFFESEELRKKLEDARRGAFPLLGYPQVSDEKFKQLFEAAIRESRHKKQAGMTPSVSLVGKEARQKKWLDAERIQKLGWNDSSDLQVYRNRYMSYLATRGRSDKYIEETKRSSLEIVKKLGDPKSNSSFDIRGLVVGNVQSGKTENFNAVINSAIDVGYDLIIVLSGIMEDLRRQTQLRIEKEVEGKYVEGKFIGVGHIASYGPRGLFPDVQPIIIPTSTETDFTRHLLGADFSLNNKNILVCKKNTGVLKNLLLWLHGYLNENKEKIKIPLLIIDDEADNASLNNLGEKGINYSSIINGHIRAILGLFDKKTYVGYTATPFANVLQDRNRASEEKWTIKDQGKNYCFDQVRSLFPTDFIELLFPPSNYIGAKHFFETNSEAIKKIAPLIVVIDDHLEAFPARLTPDRQPTNEKAGVSRAACKDDKFPLFIPASMKEAVMCFVVSTAIRISRKSSMRDTKFYQPHNTMLIHISRFITWQSQTKKLVSEYVDKLKFDLDNDLPAGEKTIYLEFERIWYKYYSYVMDNIGDYLPDDYDDDFLTPRSFEDIKPLLIEAIKNIEVKAINSLPPRDQLIYPDNEEKKYIAIGGNRLSRGFTLEGLTINYFVRNTDFADTLLQMGRWFGYRPGYIDCCKLFTTEDALNKYDQVTATIEDLEQKFIDMNRDPENTPATYRLRVLKHPGYLKITRSSILRNTKEIKCSFSDHMIQTTKFKIVNLGINKAWDAFGNFVMSRRDRFEEITNGKGEVEYLSFKSTNAEDLFALFKLPNSFADLPFDFANLESFIRACNNENKLKNWTIAIRVSGDGHDINLKSLGFSSIDAGMTIRSGPQEGTRFRKKFIDEKVFVAGGASANILSGGDFRIALDKTKSDEAVRDFKKQFEIEYRKSHPNCREEEILRSVKEAKAPEKVYRHKMTEQEGVVVIYLIDAKQIFKYKETPIPELSNLENTIETNIPLVGYAIGIPKISGDIGGIYHESLHHKDENLDNETFEDFVDVLEG